MSFTPRNRSVTTRDQSNIVQTTCLNCRYTFCETPGMMAKSAINLKGAATRLQRTMSEPIPKQQLRRKYIETCERCKKKINIDGDIIYSKSVNLKSLSKF